MKKKDGNREEAVMKLRDAIEKKVGYGFNTPADFKQAAATVVAKTERPISATTLMRIWGYVQDGGADYRPAYYSLSTLAIFLGYMDFGEFAEQGGEQADVQSEGYVGKSVAAEEVPVGTSVCVEWEPGRRCVLKRLGGHCFEVTEASRSKIVAGDRVECASFTQDAPLFCSPVWRNGEVLMASYVAGSKTGIRYRLD